MNHHPWKRLQSLNFANDGAWFRGNGQRKVGTPWKGNILQPATSYKVQPATKTICMFFFLRWSTVPAWWVQAPHFCDENYERVMKRFTNGDTPFMWTSMFMLCFETTFRSREVQGCGSAKQEIKASSNNTRVVSVRWLTTNGKWQRITSDKEGRLRKFLTTKVLLYKDID